MCYDHCAGRGTSFHTTTPKAKRELVKILIAYQVGKKKRSSKKKKRVGAERHLLLIFLTQRASKGRELRGTSDRVVVNQSGKKFIC